MHKLLFDQNLSYKLVQQLQHLFPESSHVSLLKLDQEDDRSIWQYAKDHGFHIVSKDADFIGINTLEGYPPKVIWLHAGNLRTQEILVLLEEKAETIHTFLENEQLGLLELE
jgi:predicted nuclease of predicted toxin-antitoxin system